MPDDTSDIDSFLKKQGYTGGGGGDRSASSAQSEDEGSTAADVGRGLTKSLAGTAVAIPRLANAGVGLFSSRWRNKLGDLAESVPGVKSLEGFADSPNKNWGESAGYWGGEGLQLFGGGALDLARGAAKGAEAASALGKGTEDVGGVADWSRMRRAPDTKALPPPRDVPFRLSDNASMTERFAEAARRQAAAEGADYAEGLQGERAREALDAAKAPSSRPEFSMVEGGTKAPRSRSWPYPGALGRVARAAGQGGLAGAITDPQHPGEGFVTGGALGGLTPLGGLAMRSRPGQWLASHGARSSVAAAVAGLAGMLGMHPAMLWNLGIMQALRYTYGPGGRVIGDAAEGAARRGGSALARRSGRGAGAVGGIAAGSIDPGSDSGDGPRYEPVPENELY
jgi:hypothetical protein